MAKSCESSVQDKIAEVTECSICVQIFTNPKILPCVHTFCLHCLETYGKDKKPGDRMVCPICRNEFFIPDGGLCELPNNFFIGKMVEIGKLAMAPANDLLCDLCPEGEELVAKMYCIDCERRLCERCSTSHGKIKFCQSHQVVQLGGKLNAQNFNLCSSYCDRHPKELTKVYCYDDKVGICLICCVESHQSHRCVNIEKAADDFMKQLKEDQRKVTMRLPESENVREKLDKCEKEFAEEISKTEEKIIRDVGTKLKMLIDEHTEILVKNLMSLRERNLKAIDITKQDVERFTVMIDSFSKYSEELLSRGSPVDICRAADQMHTRANELEKLPVNCSGDRFCCDTVVFHPSSFVNLGLLNQCRSNNAVGELTVIESPDRIINFGIESTVAVPCESVGVVKRFIPMDLGVFDIITKYLKYELQEIVADSKECSISIDTSEDESGFVLRGNETGVGKAVTDLRTLTNDILIWDHVIERPGIPAYFYSEEGEHLLYVIQFMHEVSIQLDSRQSLAYPQVEMTPVKSLIPVQGDKIKCKVDGDFSAANVDLSHDGGVADAIAIPEKYASAMQRTRTITGLRQPIQEQQEERHPQHSSSMIIFSIYALSKEQIYDVLKNIEDVIDGNFVGVSLDSSEDQENIAELDPEQINRIKDMANIFPVQTEVETGRRKRIRICGPYMEVTSVIDKVRDIFQEAQINKMKKMEEEGLAKLHNIFQEAQNKETNKMEDERIATVADWEYEYGNVFVKYPEEINAIIEKSYRDGAWHVEWKADKEECKLSFRTMMAGCMTNWPTPFVKVRRVTKEMVIDVDVPANWETMRNDEYFKRIQLKASDQEYKDVEKAVLSTAATTVNQIIKIERIQNKMLYKQYVVRKEAMDAANPGVQNEMTLWRGTSAYYLDSINQYGFTRRNCGKHAFLYGKGVHFAKNFSHSVASTYSSPDENGYKHVYQCKVLTGEYAVGNQDMIAPPSKLGSKTMLYDSTVDNVINPAIFVIYFNAQVYPEYLICFK